MTLPVPTGRHFNAHVKYLFNQKSLNIYIYLISNCTDTTLPVPTGRHVNTHGNIYLIKSL